MLLLFLLCATPSVPFFSLSLSLVSVQKNKGLTAVNQRAVLSSISTLFSGAIARHAVSEAIKANIKVAKRASLAEPIATESAPVAVIAPAIPAAIANANRKSRGTTCGLSFPVGRIARFLRDSPTKGSGLPINASAATSLAATLEYLTAELCELAGNKAVDGKKTNIAPEHITHAIKEDDELRALFTNTTLPEPVYSEAAEAQYADATHDTPFDFEILTDDEDAVTLADD